MKKPLTQTYSIFGQIESVIADMMTKEGRVIRRIDAVDIPRSVLYNEHGVRAHCALVMTAEQNNEFDQRVRALRA